MKKKGHKILLENFLALLREEEKISQVLDAGSGRTSISALAEYFPGADITALVYPGDQRKIGKVREIGDFPILEWDLCGGLASSYDLVTAHLLLGEAAKFGHSMDELLEGLLSVQCRYLVIIDYLEDPRVSRERIEELCRAKGLEVQYSGCVANDDWQTWVDFTGYHNFGYLFRREILG